MKTHPDSNPLPLSDSAQPDGQAKGESSNINNGPTLPRNVPILDADIDDLALEDNAEGNWYEP